MPKSANKISFWKSPVLWLLVMFSHIPMPFLWRVRVMTWGVKWMTYRKHFKDQLLGELIVVVVSVEKDWEVYQGKLSSTRARNITYRWKRDNLPFCYSTIHRGTQCTDETAHPLGLVPHQVVVDMNDRIAEFNADIVKRNEQHQNHQKLKASIIDHKFQEYNHDA